MGKKYLFLLGGENMFILQSGRLWAFWYRAGSGLSIIC